ncbi:hypothetical protein BGZ47_001217 [Haplosporangium gracile]|nr:hypothetical protein BGZ47_001217 [Haplosporangium gracile]
MQGRKPACANFYKCSLPKRQQSNTHAFLYHTPGSVQIPNKVTGGPPITIHRDPTKGMAFPCSHPNCEHRSMLKSGPLQHYKVCRFINPSHAGQSHTSARANGRFASTFSDRSDATYSYSSSSRLESGKETEHRVPLSTTSVRLLEQILGGVNRLNDRMDLLTEQVGGIQEQSDYNEDQVQNIIVTSASMDAHTESLHINVDLIGEHLGDML